MGVDIKNTFKGAPFNDIGELVSALIANAYIIAGIVLLFMMVTNGLYYLSAAGGKDPAKYQQTQLRFLYSLIGFVVIIASYWIIQIIEQITGTQIF